MLVLARQEGDGITFPDLNVEVEILKIQGNRVQVGVHAPRDIAILRSELVEDQTVAVSNSEAGSRQMDSLRAKLSEAAIQLAIARAQLERGDVEGVEKTLRAMSRSESTKSFSASQVSEKPAAYCCDDRSVHHPAQRSHRSGCQRLETIQGMEGLAC